MAGVGKREILCLAMGRGQWLGIFWFRMEFLDKSERDLQDYDTHTMCTAGVLQAFWLRYEEMG